MSRGRSNWTFADVQSFLREKGFVLQHIKGSHYYFRKYEKDRIYMTHVPFHGTKSIPEGTMGAIIRQSGIPKSEWFA